MGPDEYHERYPDRTQPGVDNNAYTNVMAVWVLVRALDTLAALPRQRRDQLLALLDLDDDELARWDAITRRMLVPFHDDVISQFSGYEQLAELDWDAYRDRYGDIARLDRILEAAGDSTDRYRLSKQADVLMLFYTLSLDELRRLFDRLGYTLSDELVARTVDDYLARTSHGSTLSRVVHAWVLARRDRAGSWDSFTRERWSPTSPTPRAAPPAKASTWAPWPAPWTSSNAATPACQSATTSCASTRSCPSSSATSACASAIGASGASRSTPPPTTSPSPPRRTTRTPSAYSSATRSSTWRPASHAPPRSAAMTAPPPRRPERRLHDPASKNANAGTKRAFHQSRSRGKRRPFPPTRGKATEMAQRVSDVMMRNPVALPATSPIQEAAARMRDDGIGDVIVLDENEQLCGIVTDRDITIRGVAERPDVSQLRLGDVCSRNVIALDPDDSVDDAVQKMRDATVRRLPVVLDGRLVGIVSIGDLAIERDPKSALANISAAPPTT
jgi:CBS domain-containing protein